MSRLPIERSGITEEAIEAAVADAVETAYEDVFELSVTFPPWVCAVVSAVLIDLVPRVNDAVITRAVEAGARAGEARASGEAAKLSEEVTVSGPSSSWVDSQRYWWPDGP